MKKTVSAFLAMLLILASVSVSIRPHAVIDYTCGSFLTWSYDEENEILYISGVGEIPDLTQPWSGLVKPKTLIVGEGVIAIGSGVFRGLSSLTTVQLPSTLVNIDDYAFNNDRSLTAITFPNGCSLICVRPNAFDGTPLFSGQSGPVYLGTMLFAYLGTMPQNTTLHLRENTTAINQSALKNQTNLVGITAPDTLYSIGASALTGTTWLENQPDGPVFVGKVLLEYKGTISLSETDFVIPDGTTGIACGAFRDQKKITGLVMPDSVLCINRSAFSGTTNLSDITFSKNLMYVEGSAFDTAKFKKLVLPATIRYIGSAAFRQNINLKEVIFEEGYSYPFISKYMFDSDWGLDHIEIPDCVIEIGDSAFFQIFLDSIVIPRSVEKIGFSNFWDSQGYEDTVICCYADSYAYEWATEKGLSCQLLESALTDRKTLNEKLAQANGLNRTLYTAQSLSRLDQAIAAVKTDENTTQAQIDQWAQALDDAMRALVYKDAVYTSVESAVADARKLDRALYTADSVAALDRAIGAVKYGLNVTEQSTVNTYASEIRRAIASLVYLPGDYSEVYLAVAEAGRTDRTLYTADSLAMLDQVLQAVVYELDISAQSTITGYAQAIRAALTELVYLPADYSEVTKAVSEASGIDRTLYTPESLQALDQAVQAIVYGLDITKQGIVNGYAQAVIQALSAKDYLPADYADVYAAISEIQQLDRSLYTFDSFSAIDQAVSRVIYGLDITQQSTVTGYANAIRIAKASLVFFPADYSEVYAAVQEAESIDRILYTEADTAALQQSLDAVVYGKNITEQETVNGYALGIRQAILRLQYRTVVLHNDENGVLVSASAKVIYPKTVLTVDRVDSSNVEIANFAVGGRVTSANYYDINLILNGSRVQPQGMTQVKIRIPEGVDPLKCKVYHVSDDPVSPLVKYSSTLDGSYIVFETDHFSEFAVVEVTTVPVGLEIVQPPVQTVYSIGETLRTDGLRVRALFSDGASAEVTGYDVSAVDMTTTGEKTVTVYYTSGDVTKTAAFRITVNASAFAVSILTQGSEAERYDRKVKWYRPYKKERLQLTASLSENKNVRLEWSSDNGKVLVDQNGLITNKGWFGARKATITVTALDSMNHVLGTDRITVRFYKFPFQLRSLQNAACTL